VNEEFLYDCNPQAQQFNESEILKEGHFRFNGKLIGGQKDYNGSIKKPGPSGQGQESYSGEI
jgi:hypothetical protein